MRPPMVGFLTKLLYSSWPCCEQKKYVFPFASRDIYIKSQSKQNRIKHSRPLQHHSHSCTLLYSVHGLCTVLSTYFAVVSTSPPLPSNNRDFSYLCMLTLFILDLSLLFLSYSIILIKKINYIQVSILFSSGVCRSVISW